MSKMRITGMFTISLLSLQKEIICLQKVAIDVKSYHTQLISHLLDSLICIFLYESQPNHLDHIP